MAPGDLTDEQWAALEPLLPTGKKPGGPPTWNRRQLIDGIRFRVRTDIPWRDIPKRAFCPGEFVWFEVQVSRQFGVDSRVSLRLMRSIIAMWIMASERWGWVS
ncbi:transposase [Streptomyces sp. NPDC004069]